MNPDPAIQALINKGTLTLEGKQQSVMHVPRKFIWSQFRFEREHWMVHEVFVYTDPIHRFPIFDWNEIKFRTEAEMNQWLLLDRLEA